MEWLHERFHEVCLTMLKEPSATQAADIFTKAFANPQKWAEVRDLINLFDPNTKYWIPKPPPPPVDKEAEKQKRKKEYFARAPIKRGDTDESVDEFDGLSNANYINMARFAGAAATDVDGEAPAEDAEVVEDQLTGQRKDSAVTEAKRWRKGY